MNLQTLSALVRSVPDLLRADFEQSDADGTRQPAITCSSGLP